jgi:hypothetical protein
MVCSGHESPALDPNFVFTNSRQASQTLGGGRKHKDSGPHSDMKWNPKKGCLNEPMQSLKIAQSIVFSEEQTLSLIQTVEERHDDDRRDERYPNIWGEVNLVSVPDGAPGYAEVTYMTNHDSLKVSVDFDKASQEFKVVVPRAVAWSSLVLAPCVQIQIELGVPARTSSRVSSLKSFAVSAVHLDINVEKGVSLFVTDGISLLTTSGDVATPSLSYKGTDPYSFNSRKTVITTISGSIKGWFALYDLLQLHTVSGDITADISPKEVDDDHPKPASLVVESISGTVRLTEPIESASKSTKLSKAFPARDYAVKVHATSGDILVKLAMTSRASFETISGNI